jgi:hypothetical protein
MAVTGVGNLTELISNQSLGQSQEAPAGAPAAQLESNVAVVPAGDSFTPSTQTSSTQNAQDAGLFQVSQYALTSATAEALTAQTTAPAVAHNPAPTPAAEIATTTVTTQSTATAPPPEPAAAPSVAASPQATSNAVAPVPVNTQDLVQSLNAILLGLGLSNGDIQQIDRIASVTNSYSPALYGDLIQQFEAQTAQQPSVPDAGNQSVT